MDEQAKKPRVKLTGTDSNVFALIGLCSKTLRHAGQPEKAKEMAHRCFQATSFHQALAIMQEYVDAR